MSGRFLGREFLDRDLLGRDRGHTALPGPALRVPPRDDRLRSWHRRRPGHTVLMAVCCLPMLAVVAVLIVTGTAGSSALWFAALCLVMMGAMMFGMSGGRRH